MFEKALEQNLKAIFGIERITFDAPSESNEQDVLFIQISVSNNTIKDGAQIARVTGTLHMFSMNTKLPYGFFSKKIHEAKPSWTKPFFFFDLEENSNRYRDICERSASFVYFFNSQYDPDLGTMNSITLQTQVTE